MNLVANVLILFFIRYEIFDFWCWSRRDYIETDLRQVSITLNFREEVFTSFNTSFFYNQTSKSIKCNSQDEWAESWIDVSDTWHPPSNIPCSTNVSAVAVFDWFSFQQKL